MPVSFKTLLHTKPYKIEDDLPDDDDEDIDLKQPELSSMLVMFELGSQKKPQAQYVAAQPLAQQIKLLTGSMPKIWGYTD